MIKAKKLAGARLVPALLTCALLFFAVPGTVSAATSSFTPNSNNFRAVFDFDTVPATYTEGYKPGTRSDTIGLGKSQKAITGEGLGLTYDLTIVKNNALDGGLALQIDVKDLAPENGAYCPITLRPDYGDNLQNNAKGAEYFAFWVDTTKFVDQDGNHISRRMDFYVQEMDVEANGTVSKDNVTAWRPDYKKSAGSPYYEYEDGRGGWLRGEDFTVLDFGLPTDYQGWIRFPINTLVHTDWTTVDTDGVFNGNDVEYVSLGLGNYASFKGSTYLFDQIGFMGNFSSGSSDKTKTQPPKTTTKSPTGGTTTTANNSSGDANSVATADPTGNDPTGNDPTADTTDGTNTFGTTNPTTSGDENKTTGVGVVVDKGGTGGSFPWGWIVAAVVVVILAGGGVTLYLLYKKGKLPFSKSSGGDGE